MQKSQIGDNCIIDGVIIDKDVKIGDGVVLKGSADEPYVVEKEAYKTVRLIVILKNQWGLFPPLIKVLI